MFDDILHWQLLLLAVLQVSVLSVDLMVVVAVATTAIESETTTLTRGQQRQQKRRETDKLHNLLRTWNIEQTILCYHG